MRKLLNLFSIISPILAIVLVILFIFGYSLPLIFGVIILGISLLSQVNFFLQKKIGFLSVFAYLIYCLPFIHFIEYFFYDFDSPPALTWSMVTSPYNSILGIVRIALTLSTIGALSFNFIPNLKSLKLIRSSSIVSPKIHNTLSLIPWSFFLIFALYLSYISAPTDAITEAVYASSSSFSRDVGFDSSWVFSYCIVIFLAMDILFERKPSLKLTKKLLLVSSIIYMVLWDSLLRGEREGLMLLGSFILFYFFYWKNFSQFIKPTRLTDAEKKASTIIQYSRFKIVILTFSLLAISFVTALFRSRISLYSFSEVLDIGAEILYIEGFANLIKGTWTAVLSTIFSVSGDHYYQIHSINYGNDYLNHIYSILPGFVSKWLGLVRPVDEEGIAAQLLYTGGGYHNIVITFRSFSVFGIYLITSLWYYLIVSLEKNLARTVNIYTCSLLALLILIMPKWLWYTDKNLMNALIIYVIIAFLFNIFSMKRKNPNGI